MINQIYVPADAGQWFVKEVLDLPRIIRYIVVGATAQLVRSIGFNFLVIESGFGQHKANFWSIIPSLLVAFWLHNLLTWRDRPGETRNKLIRFLTVDAGLIFFTRVLIYPVWLSLAGRLYIGYLAKCPGQEFFHWLTVWIFRDSLLAKFGLWFFSCEHLRLIPVDFMVAVTLAYLLHDKISFGKVFNVKKII